MDDAVNFVGYSATVRDAAWKELGELHFVVSMSWTDDHMLSWIDAVVRDHFSKTCRLSRVLGAVCFGQVATRNQVPDLMRANAERWNPHVLRVPVCLWIE
jgi:hypothetical protein